MSVKKQTADPDTDNHLTGILQTGQRNSKRTSLAKNCDVSEKIGVIEIQKRPNVGHL